MKSVVVTVYVCALAACACGRDAVEASDAGATADTRRDESALARQALIDGLVAEGTAPDAIRVDTTEGPLGTTRLRTIVEGAYPGAGMRTALLADGLHYGKAGRDLAELARARHWHDTPPAPADLAALATFGWLPQMALDEDGAPELSRDAQALTLTLAVRELPGGEHARVVMTLPQVGAARIDVTSSEPPPPEVPADPLAALEQALSTGDAMAMLDALRKVSGVAASPTRSKLLARAAVLPNETIAFEAMNQLDASDEAAAALREASARLSADDRQEVVKRAATAHGEAFARKLAP